MASYSTPTQALPRQLSLDLDLYVANTPEPKPSVERSVIFPKNIQIFNVAEFQKRVSALFDPLHINIEFRLTRHNRLEMRWSFPDEAVQYNQIADRPGPGLSPEENKVFETLVLSFAGASH
jgi:hypothetical protein